MKMLLLGFIHTHTQPQRTGLVQPGLWNYRRGHKGQSLGVSHSELETLGLHEAAPVKTGRACHVCACQCSAAVVVGVFWLQRDTGRFSQLDLMLHVSLGSCLQLSDSALRCPCRVRLGMQPELEGAAKVITGAIPDIQVSWPSRSGVPSYVRNKMSSSSRQMFLDVVSRLDVDERLDVFSRDHMFVRSQTRTSWAPFWVWILVKRLLTSCWRWVQWWGTSGAADHGTVSPLSAVVPGTPRADP